MLYDTCVCVVAIEIYDLATAVSKPQPFRVHEHHYLLNEDDVRSTILTNILDRDVCVNDKRRAS